MSKTATHITPHAAIAPRAGGSRGFTLLETLVVTSLIALLLAALTPIFTSNSTLVEDTVARKRAESAHRRNMAAVTRVLRAVDITTLSGFNPQGVATAPSFARVTGADDADLTYTGSETLRWVSSPVPVRGVERPGAIYLERGGQRFLVADRVPAGGFKVRQEGASLVVDLTTYWATNDGHTATTNSQMVVSIRN